MTCYGPIVPLFSKFGTIQVLPHTLALALRRTMETSAKFDIDSFAEHFICFGHCQTTYDNFLGVEINEFVKNSIDSGAASAGWSCFANVEEKNSFKM